MNRTTLLSCTAALLMVGLVGCASDHDDVAHDQPTPEPTVEQTIRPPGSFQGDRDAMLEDMPTSPSATAQDDEAVSDDAVEQIDNPRADEYREDNPEDRRDRSGAREAMERGLKASEELDDGLPGTYMVPEDLTEMDALSLDWWSERDEVIGERIAEVATSFDPVDDFNRDEAWVRASYLLSPSAQLDDISHYPGLDASWVSAQQCNATAEVFVEYQSSVVEDSVQTLPAFQVLAEYRWVDGDSGCDLIQPDYFYEYDMSLGSDGTAVRLDRTVLDDQLHDRPSGWDM